MARIVQLGRRMCWTIWFAGNTNERVRESVVISVFFALTDPDLRSDGIPIHTTHSRPFHPPTPPLFHLHHAYTDSNVLPSLPLNDTTPCVNSRLDSGEHLDFTKSFFLHVAYENPHVPLFVSDEYAATHEPSRRGQYGDSVSEMDASIGAILDTLESTGLADNTIVVFTSDNGAWVKPNNGLTARPVKGIDIF